MSFVFDLISDLHVETWNGFDWTDQATSPYCVVAGDVSRDRQTLLRTLEHLGTCYAGVFYIDGNDEHRHEMENIGQSYKDLTKAIKKIPNVIYMQDNVIIINGVALLATNGWWSYDFDCTADSDQALQWYADYVKISDSAARSVRSMAYHDAAYLTNSVKKLQTHQEVDHIVLISHTVPAPWLAEHDIELVGTHRYSCLGNQQLQLALDEDTENKIHTWCFGHYHKAVDRDFAGVRYVNNCRGRGGTAWSQSVYYPKRIEIA